jgi:hypothetical protein
VILLARPTDGPIRRSAFFVGDMVKIKLELKTDKRMALRMVAEHAPAGGINIEGKQFQGGEFIPAEVAAKATPSQKVDLKKSRRQRQAKKKKITIQQAGKLLAERGITLVGGAGFDFQRKMATFIIEDQGEQQVVTSEDIKEILFPG